jgi:asparagine synthase (glutamine-hydrolysing)
MCGIAAAIGVRDPTVFHTLFEALAHRGPDDRGVAEVGDIRIGTHRLSIVGGDGVTLPLQSADQRYLLAFNGEIYNHRELRRQFDDYPWRTTTDGEVVFPILAAEGLKGLDRLRGMFAFVLVEVATGRFLAVRDPLGIKPLYYARLDGGVVFASELKSLAGLPCIPNFLPPGHVLDQDGLKRWYRVPGRFFRPRRPPLTQLLEQAVQSHLPESGPCGVFLSGGVDSSLVAALAARLRPDIVAYTVVLPGSADEEPAAEVARYLGIRHKVLRATEEEAQSIVGETVAALESHNPVMVRNAVPLYLLSRFVGTDCKVVLGGDGADELFAGYDYLATLPRRNWQAAIDIGINNLHRTELQRVDRMTMAHGIELRVPFLDRAVVEADVDLPLSHKAGRHDGRPVNKLALRQAAAGLLPDRLRWRQKQPMVEGSGFARLRLEPGDLFRYWRQRFASVDLNRPIWADAARYGDFQCRHGWPLLELFRG